jgi:serine/threonine-protein kinase
MLLEIGREGEPGKPHEWDGERALVIGRGRKTEMMISDPLLSRRHCQLELSGGVVFIHDLGSANGTFVNGIQATRAALAAGDLVTFGRSWLRVVPELAQVKIGGSGDQDDPHTTRRFDKRAAPTAPERRYELPESEASYPPIDGYVLFGTIGKGSFGTVYRAKNRANGRLAAIKVIPTGASAKPENVARFLREIEATGQLTHQNLVEVYGAGEGPHFAYLIMEHVDGDTLARAIQRDGKLDPARSLEIGRQIASALEHAFSRGFVHRDVKPENILIDASGTAKLCDFGLVKNLAASSGANLTRPGQGFGSLAYMPPEQVREAATADQRADVYSLGATLYNALTGRRPFSGPVNKGFLRRVMEEYPDPIDTITTDVPKEVIRIIDRCLQKDPALRYQSPRELREAIEDVLRVASTGLEPALPGLLLGTPGARSPAPDAPGGVRGPPQQSGSPAGAPDTRPSAAYSLALDSPAGGETANLVSPPLDAVPAPSAPGSCAICPCPRARHRRLPS